MKSIANTQIFNKSRQAPTNTESMKTTYKSSSIKHNFPTSVKIGAKQLAAFLDDDDVNTNTTTNV
jgi:hypothetical protein